MALKDAEKIQRKWDAISPPETPSQILVGETLALVVVCVFGLALNFCAFYMGRKNGLKKTRIYMKVSDRDSVVSTIVMVFLCAPVRLCRGARQFELIPIGALCVCISRRKEKSFI